jgi:hypothetical protein
MLPVWKKIEESEYILAGESLYTHPPHTQTHTHTHTQTHTDRHRHRHRYRYGSTPT